MTLLLRYNTCIRKLSLLGHSDCPNSFWAISLKRVAAATEPSQTRVPRSQWAQDHGWCWCCFQVRDVECLAHAWWLSVHCTVAACVPAGCLVGGSSRCTVPSVDKPTGGALLSDQFFSGTYSVWLLLFIYKLQLWNSLPFSIYLNFELGCVCMCLESLVTFKLLLSSL